MKKRFDINPGEFKHKVKILSAIEIKNDDDMIEKVFSPIYEGKAKIKNYKGKEFVDGNSVHSVVETKFFLRRLKFAPKNTDFIEFNSVKYNITDVNNIDEANILFEIMTKKVD